MIYTILVVRQKTERIDLVGYITIKNIKSRVIKIEKKWKNTYQSMSAWELGASKR